MLKGNCVHQKWIKAPFKTWKIDAERSSEQERSQSDQNAIIMSSF